MNNLHVKTGDNVMIISGKDKGHTGKVLQVSPSENKVIVEGQNMVTKHVKPVMQIPKLDKVVINVACGEAKDNEKILEAVMKDLGQITGQKAVVCRAKKSVANFKLRQGTPIGCKVTLRGERMYEFVDRFFNIALPRVRDFRGINGNGFDGRGNFACGIKEQIIFPEIDFEKVDAVRGMDVCFVTTAKTDEEGKELLKALGAPFAENN